MGNDLLKKASPHLIAILVFALITIAFFSPLFQGEILYQNDILQGKGMAKEIIDYRNDTGKEALWTNSMFGGMPAYHISLRSPGNLIKKISKVLMLGFPSPAKFMLLGFIGFYILLLCLGVNHWLSIVGSISYFMCSFLIVSMEAGHNTKVLNIAYMAPVIGGAILAYRKRLLLGAAIFAFFFSLAIAANHLQITYYTAMCLLILGIYFIVDAIKHQKIPHLLKFIGIMILSAMVAVGPNISKLWSTYEYAQETIRGGKSELSAKKAETKGGLDFDYATNWSYGIGESMTLLIPNAKGGGSAVPVSESSPVGELISRGRSEKQVKQLLSNMPMYFGDQPSTSGPVYIGAFAIFCFLMAMLMLKDTIKWPLLAIIILGLSLSWGRNLSGWFNLFFEYFPMFNKFRTPSMILVLPQMVVPLLGILFLNNLLKGSYTKPDLFKNGKIALGVLAGIIVLFGVLPSFSGNFTAPVDEQYLQNNQDAFVTALRETRAQMVLNDSIRSLVFIFLGAGLLWMFVSSKIQKKFFIGLLGLLFLVDHWTVDRRYIGEENFKAEKEYNQLLRPTQADQQIIQDTDPYYRVFNVTRNPFNDALTSYFHKSVGGYHPAKLIIYQDLIENQIAKNNPAVLNMLNTKYYIGKDKSGNLAPQRNPDALGNAWFIDEIQWVDNADDEMKALDNFKPKNTAIIDKRFESAVNMDFTNNRTGSVKLIEYLPNKLVFESKNQVNGFAVFSDVYYPPEKGWKVSIDGEESSFVRVNYALRGMNIPSGDHSIVFEFKPQSFYTGEKIAYATSFVLLAFLMGTLFFEYRKSRDEESNR